MKKIDKLYKFKQARDRITEYDLDDIINCDNVDVFNTNPKWPGARINYDSFLSKGKFKKGKISPEYRKRLKQDIMKKVTKMYFRMIMDDILEGHKIKIGMKYIRFFIGNRNFTSKKYLRGNHNGAIEYIPYIYLSKNITKGVEWKMNYLRFSEKYNKIFKKLLRNGRKYKLNNG